MPENDASSTEINVLLLWADKSLMILVQQNVLLLRAAKSLRMILVQQNVLLLRAAE